MNAASDDEVGRAVLAMARKAVEYCIRAYPDFAGYADDMVSAASLALLGVLGTRTVPDANGYYFATCRNAAWEEANKLAGNRRTKAGGYESRSFVPLDAVEDTLATDEPGVLEDQILRRVDILNAKRSLHAERR